VIVKKSSKSLDTSCGTLGILYPECIMNTVEHKFLTCPLSEIYLIYTACDRTDSDHWTIPGLHAFIIHKDVGPILTAALILKIKKS
jgi:hypothetical protein